jgi:hypothetical protein
MCHSGCHFQVLFAGAVPFFLFLRSDLDIETIGFETLTHQFIEHHGGVDATRKQHCDFLVFQIHAAKVVQIKRNTKKNYFFSFISEMQPAFTKGESINYLEN